MYINDTSRFAFEVAEAVGLHLQGRLAHAKEQYSALIARYPSHAEPLRLLGLLHLQAGEGEQAVVMLERCLALAPGHVMAWSDLARACAVAGKPFYAEAAAVRALALDPGHGESMVTLARILQERGAEDGALSVLERACASRPDWPEGAFQLARALRRAHRREEAAAQYLACLRLAPAHAEAHNDYGLLMLEDGRIDTALAHFDEAIRVRPAFAEALYNRGLACRRAGRSEDAVAAYERALSVRPDYPDALNNLGNLKLALGRIDEAEELLRRAFDTSPDFLLAGTNLIALLMQGGRFEDAECILEQACRRHGSKVELDLCRAALHHAKGHADEASAVLERLLRDHPRHVGAIDLKARILREGRKLREAILCLEPVAGIEPGAVDRWNDLGAMYVNLQQPDKAIPCLERALRMNPDLPGTINNLALAYKGQGRLIEAEALLRELMSKQQDMHTIANLSLVLAAKGELAEALRVLDEGIAAFPDAPALRCNRGAVLLESGDFEGARTVLQDSLRMAPDLVLAQWNLAFCHLALGEFERGWECYEARLHSDFPSSVFHKQPLPPCRLWKGEDLAGRSLLVVAEQGFGDQIQVLRFAAELERRGAELTFFTCPPMVRLAQSVSGIKTALSTLTQQPFDYAVYCMSLPGLLKVDAGNMPGEVPYVRADPAQVLAWQRRLGALAGGRPKVGVVWSGSPTHTNDRNRSMAAERFARLFPDEGICWISLNKAVQDDLTLAGQAVHALARDCQDFSDTAALIQALDLVVTVDTAVAHLAGALGKPCWILLPATPDWRWLTTGAESRWYPSVRLFRQQRLGEWEPVLDEVRQALPATLEQAGTGRLASPERGRGGCQGVNPR